MCTDAPGRSVHPNGRPPVTDRCYPCVRNEDIASLPPREHVHAQRGWRLAHAFDSALPGWLVLVPTRHVEALHELSADEAQTMGELLVSASAALRAVLGCTKTYTMLFAEAPGFAHLHVHLVPRMPSFTRDDVGPNVFRFLGHSDGTRVRDAEQDRLSLELGTHISTGTWSS